MAGSFALNGVLHEVKYGDWNSSHTKRVLFVTRSPYLYGPLANGSIFKWQLYDWMVRKDGIIMERLNKDLWEGIADILNDFENIGMEVVTMFLEKENDSVLNTLIENPIALTLQASNGTSLIKDECYCLPEGICVYTVIDRCRPSPVNFCGYFMKIMIQ